MEVLTTKRIIRRNLPINDKYVLIDSFYAGMENGTCCDNCNKIIANIAVIKNNDNDVFHVGMDCAATLTQLTGLFAAEMQFAEAKGIRAKVNKAKKDGKQITFENTYFGEIKVSANEVGIVWLKREFMQKYLPDYFANISNPDKNTFEAIPEIAFNTFTSATTSEAREYYKTVRNYNYNGLTVSISLSTGTKLDGTSNGSILFVMNVSKDGQPISNRSTYMVKDINHLITCSINEYLFNQL